MFPFAGMPGRAQAPGEVFALTHVLRRVRGVMSKGASAADVAPRRTPLVGVLPLDAAIALPRFRRTLD